MVCVFQSWKPFWPLKLNMNSLIIAHNEMCLAYLCIIESEHKSEAHGWLMWVQSSDSWVASVTNTSSFIMVCWWLTGNTCSSNHFSLSCVSSSHCAHFLLSVYFNTHWLIRLTNRIIRASASIYWSWTFSKGWKIYDSWSIFIACVDFFILCLVFNVTGADKSVR